MLTPEQREEAELLASLSGWDIASHFGCRYTGDMNPIQYGGHFYDPRSWEEDKEADIVEFWLNEENWDDPILNVQRGTLYRPDQKMVDEAFKCFEEELPRTPECEIEALLNHTGYDHHGHEYPGLIRFRLSTWKEWRIWKQVTPWLRALGDVSCPA